MRDFLGLFESNKKANLAIFISVFMLVTYKVWKWYLRNKMGLDPYNDYLVYEILSTGFRYLGAIVCLLSAYFLHSNRDTLYKGRGKVIYLLLVVYPLGYLILKNHLLGASFSSTRFLQELPINFAVGFWEEGAYRALLFAGLLKYMKPSWALIISGIGFSIWHFDVVDAPIEFFDLFIASGCFTLLYILGASILQLSVMHFIWDQIHYGLVWGQGTQGYAVTIYEVISFCIFLLVANRLNRSN